MDSKEKKDEELFKETCSGKEQSFRALYARYTDKMLSRAGWIYRSSHTCVEDIIDEVWEKLLRSCGKEGPYQNFGGYLWTTLANNIRDHLRQEQIKNNYFHDNTNDNEDDWPDSNSPSIEDLASIDQKIRVAKNCLDQLPVEQREAFVLYAEGRSASEIARCLNIKEEAAKSRVRRARNRLKELLPKEYYEKN